METQEIDPVSPQQSDSDNEEPDEKTVVPVKKKGSKAQGRKRTKTGCLSERFLSIL
jgi:hypothetical protein